MEAPQVQHRTCDSRILHLRYLAFGESLGRTLSLLRDSRLSVVEWQMYEPLGKTPQVTSQPYAVCSWSAFSRDLFRKQLGHSQLSLAACRFLPCQSESWASSVSIPSPIISLRSASESNPANCETASVILGSIRPSSGIGSIATSSSRSRSSS